MTIQISDGIMFFIRWPISSELIDAITHDIYSSSQMKLGWLEPEKPQASPKYGSDKNDTILPARYFENEHTDFLIGTSPYASFGVVRQTFHISRIHPYAPRLPIKIPRQDSSAQKRPHLSSPDTRQYRRSVGNSTMHIFRRSGEAHRPFGLKKARGEWQITSSLKKLVIACKLQIIWYFCLKYLFHSGEHRPIRP